MPLGNLKVLQTGSHGHLVRRFTVFIHMVFLSYGWSTREYPFCKIQKGKGRSNGHWTTGAFQEAPFENSWPGASHNFRRSLEARALEMAQVTAGDGSMASHFGGFWMFIQLKRVSMLSHHQMVYGMIWYEILKRNHSQRNLRFEAWDHMRPETKEPAAAARKVVGRWSKVEGNNN